MQKELQYTAVFLQLKLIFKVTTIIENGHNIKFCAFVCYLALKCFLPKEGHEKMLATVRGGA